MCESDKDAVAVLVAVDNAQFAGALINVLKTCAPFPIRAAFTNSVQHAAHYLEQFKVDVILLDSTLPDCRNEITLAKIRQSSDSAAIVFVKNSDPDLESMLLHLGAHRVFSRVSLDPMSLVRTVEEIAGNTWRQQITLCARAQTQQAGARDVMAHEMEHGLRSVAPRCVSAKRTGGNTKRTSQMHGMSRGNTALAAVPMSAYRNETPIEEEEVARASVSDWRKRLRGAQRLYQLLMENKVPGARQRQMLRRLLLNCIQTEEWP